jgi:recombination protein RecA
LAKNNSPIAKDIAKAYGADVLMGFDELPFKETFLSTGVPSVDLSTRGGLPVGRIIEFYGKEASGKTGLSLRTCAGVQQLGGRAMFVDMEYALSKDWAVKMGCLPDADGFDIVRPGSGEEALAIVEIAATSGAYDVIVVDSVASLVPAAEQSRDMGDLTVGTIARLMSSSLRRLAVQFYRNNVVAIFINQVRTGIIKGGSYKTTPGGLALKFHASMRVECDVAGYVNDDKGERCGYTLRTHIPKNKIGVPFGTGLTPILYASGIDLPTDIFNLAVIYEIVTQNGSWFKYRIPGTEEEKSWQGARRASEELANDPKVLLSLLESVEQASGYPMLGGTLVRKELGAENEE